MLNKARKYALLNQKRNRFKDIALKKKKSKFLQRKKPILRYFGIEVYFDSLFTMFITHQFIDFTTKSLIVYELEWQISWKASQLNFPVWRRSFNYICMYFVSFSKMKGKFIMRPIESIPKQLFKSAFPSVAFNNKNEWQKNNWSQTKNQQNAFYSFWRLTIDIRSLSFSCVN